MDDVIYYLLMLVYGLSVVGLVYAAGWVHGTHGWDRTLTDEEIRQHVGEVWQP